MPSTAPDAPLNYVPAVLGRDRTEQGVMTGDGVTTVLRSDSGLVLLAALC